MRFPCVCCHSIPFRLVKSLFEKSVAKPFFVTYRKFFHVFIVVYYIPVAPLGLGYTGIWRFYTPSAPLGLLKAGAQCAPYLKNVLFKRVLKRLKPMKRNPQLIDLM